MNITPGTPLIEPFVCVPHGGISLRHYFGKEVESLID